MIEVNPGLAGKPQPKSIWCKGGSQLGSEKIRILQLAVSTANLDGNYIKQNKIHSQTFLKEASVGVSQTQSISSHRRDWPKYMFLHRVKKNKQCMTAKLTGKPKVSKINLIWPPFLNRFNIICQQGSWYETITFTDFLFQRAWDDYFFACKRAAEQAFPLEEIKCYRKEAVTSEGESPCLHFRF